jgi:electron transfer DM13
MIAAIRSKLLVLGILISIYACIGDEFVDDFVEPRVEVINAIDSLKIGETYQYEYRYFNNIGAIDSTVAVSWQSVNPTLLVITNEGLATAISNGSVEIVLSSLTNPPYFDTVGVVTNMLESSLPGNPMVRNGVIKTTSNYLLAGDMQLVNQDGNFILKLASNFMATNALPGLYIYLTNNPSSNSGALEIGPITQFTGAQEFALPSLANINDYDFVLFYCKPFAVKVGDGKLM